MREYKDVNLKCHSNFMNRMLNIQYSGPKMSPITRIGGKFLDIVKSARAKDLIDIMFVSALQCKGKTSVSKHNPFHFILDCYN